MDNRITKNRLQSFLSYEWIKVIMFTLIFIIVWEFVYTVSAVRLTPGQEFEIYFDQDLRVAVDTSKFISSLKGKDGLSYDVLEINTETFMSDEDNIMQYRIQAGMGDVVFAGDISHE